MQYLGYSYTPKSWRRKWQPTSMFLLGEFHDQRSLAGYGPWNCRVRHNWMTNTTNTATQKVTVYINLNLTGYTIFYLLSLAVKIYGEGFTEELAWRGPRAGFGPSGQGRWRHGAWRPLQRWALPLATPGDSPTGLAYLPSWRVTSAPSRNCQVFFFLPQTLTSLTDRLKKCSMVRETLWIPLRYIRPGRWSWQLCPPVGTRARSFVYSFVHMLLAWLVH